MSHRLALQGLLDPPTCYRPHPRDDAHVVRVGRRVEGEAVALLQGDVVARGPHGRVDVQHGDGHVVHRPVAPGVGDHERYLVLANDVEGDLGGHSGKLPLLHVVVEDPQVVHHAHIVSGAGAVEDDLGVLVRHDIVPGTRLGKFRVQHCDEHGVGPLVPLDVHQRQGHGVLSRDVEDEGHVGARTGHGAAIVLEGPAPAGHLLVVAAAAAVKFHRFSLVDGNVTARDNRWRFGVPHGHPEGNGILVPGGVGHYQCDGAHPRLREGQVHLWAIEDDIDALARDGPGPVDHTLVVGGGRAVEGHDLVLSHRPVLPGDGVGRGHVLDRHVDGGLVPEARGVLDPEGDGVHTHLDEGVGDLGGVVGGDGSPRVCDGPLVGLDAPVVG